MTRVPHYLSALAVLAWVVALAGCAGQGEDTGTSGSPAAPAASGGGGQEAAAEGAGHEHGEEGEHAEATSPEIQEALAKLSDEDRVLAESQKVCPVSGEPLGSMGVPVKVTVKDRDVFLCCEGCKGEIEKDPDKYLAKLDQ